MIFTLTLLTLLLANGLLSAGDDTLSQVQSCCNLVSDMEDGCHSACMKFASKCPPVAENKTEYLSNYCTEVPSALDACLSSTNLTNSPQTIKPTPAPELIQCCNTSFTQSCTNVCIEQLFTGDLESDETIEAVIAECGPPLTFDADPIWSCFFSLAAPSTKSATDESTTPTTTTDTPDDADSDCSSEVDPPPTTKPTEPPLTITYADWPRLHCCERANTSACKKACEQEYSGNRIDGTWEKLNLDCIYQPYEDELAICLNDVTHQCQLGCSGLSFCRNLNNRPLQLYRNCDSIADNTAKNSYKSWMDTFSISFPILPTITTKDISKCHPDLWKAAACAIYTRPCDNTTHSAILCKDDCLTLMEDCIDEKLEKRTAEEICEVLSPSSLQGKCVDIKQFTDPSPYSPSDTAFITTPCHANLCTDGRHCIVNHDCSGSDDRPCSTYHCVEESLVGKSPHMSFAKTSMIHVSTLPKPEEKCNGFVRQMENGEFGQQLVDLTNTYCDTVEQCKYMDITYDHGAVFNLTDGCNFCTCNHGNVSCTSHACSDNTGHTPIQSCDCPVSVYVPVCITSSQRTLHSPCIANCLGYRREQYTFGSCSDNSPCDHSLCPKGKQCVPQKHVCLLSNISNNATSCPQYSCEDVFSCNKFTGPVCSTIGNQHDSLCDIFFTTETIDYFGYCQTECFSGRSRKVCGVNGETYQTKCHALQEGIAVDYIGECSHVSSGSDGCEYAKCPGEYYFNTNETCRGPVPLGACCSQCGAMVQVIMDNEGLYRSTTALNRTVNSTNILDRMRTQLDVLECRLDGYLALDGTFVFLLTPTNHTSFLNVEVCNSEAVRLATLINGRSPILVTDPFLHFLTAAMPSFATKELVTDDVLIHDSIGANGSGKDMPVFFLTLFIVVLCINVIQWQ